MFQPASIWGSNDSAPCCRHEFIPSPHKSHRRLALAVALWGCGSTNSFTRNADGQRVDTDRDRQHGTPPPSGSGGSGGTGGSSSTPGFGDQLAACGTKNGTTYQITGRVIDATTGQPIAGTVLISVDPVDQGGSLNEIKAGTEANSRR
jgi:hypothetical protein